MWQARDGDEAYEMRSGGGLHWIRLGAVGGVAARREIVRKQCQGPAWCAAGGMIPIGCPHGTGGQSGRGWFRPFVRGGPDSGGRGFRRGARVYRFYPVRAREWIRGGRWRREGEIWALVLPPDRRVRGRWERFAERGCPVCGWSRRGPRAGARTSNGWRRRRT